MKKILLSLFGMVLLGLSSMVSGQQKIDGIAAIVGNEIILESDLNYMVLQYSMQTQQNVTQDQALYQRLSKDFLVRMIDEKMLLIKAKEDTIEANPEEVDQYVDQQVNGMLQKVGSQAQLEEVYGAPLAKIKKDFRKQIGDRMVIDQLRRMKFAGTNISRREVGQFYSQFADSLPEMKETVDISHILMQIKPSDESTTQALSRIQEVQEKLEAGEDFGELAKQYSEDPSSANGGDLGWFNRGAFVQEFEETAYQLGENEISGIVQTQFGFHIIQLLERQGERIHVRHILIQLRPTEEDENRVVERMREIREAIVSGETTFEEMAIENSDDPNVQVDKGHLGEFTSGSFQYQVFEDISALLEPGEISEPFKSNFGIHLMILNNRMQPRKLDLDADWQTVQRYALEFKRENLFKGWLDELRREIPVINRRGS